MLTRRSRNEEVASYRHGGCCPEEQARADRSGCDAMRARAGGSQGQVIGGGAQRRPRRGRGTPRMRPLWGDEKIRTQEAVRRTGQRANAAPGPSEPSLRR